MLKKRFKISIIGLGLMGGSFAYALRDFNNCEITGFDINEETMKKALSANAADKLAGNVKEAVCDAELVIFCTPPHNIVKDITENIKHFKNNSVVTEICGVKREIYSKIIPILPENIDFVGIHPMAGKEVGGFANSDKSIFQGAGFVIVSHEKCKSASVNLLEDISSYVGAGRICVNNAEEHDNIIAYTSDLMHISAAALCKSYPQNMTLTHTAGAFRDCTRIADIDAELWTELCLNNSGNILPYLQKYIDNLTEFRTALESGDEKFINKFLADASENKKGIKKL